MKERRKEERKEGGKKITWNQINDDVNKYNQIKQSKVHAIYFHNR